MARELIFFIVLLVAAGIGGYLLFGTEAEVAEAEAFLEETTEVVAAELEGREPEIEPKEAAEPTKTIRPMEEFLPNELPEGISLRAMSHEQTSTDISSLTAGYDGGMVITIFNCSDESVAEDLKAKWERNYRQEREPIDVWINEQQANQFVDEDLVPKAYSWRAGNFLFTIDRTQADPEGNLLKMAKQIGPK